MTGKGADSMGQRTPSSKRQFHASLKGRHALDRPCTLSTRPSHMTDEQSAERAVCGVANLALGATISQPKGVTLVLVDMLLELARNDQSLDSERPAGEEGSSVGDGRTPQGGFDHRCLCFDGDWN